MSKANELFPSIGSAADKADLLPENDKEFGESNADDTEDRPTQEIESLCMKCGEQVLILLDPRSKMSDCSPSRALPGCCSRQFHFSAKSS